MFTGIIEAQGQVVGIKDMSGDRRIRFESAGYFRGCVLGDSIAVNGVCLTAVQLGDDFFVADLSGETLKLTTAGQWAPGMPVNLEKALTAGKALGGHLVSGHVDGIATLSARAEDARSIRLDFEAPAALGRYLARKGSVCLDGISLTLNEVSGHHFSVNIVPHTAGQTTLGAAKVGGRVNLEVDLIARYLEKLLESRSA